MHECCPQHLNIGTAIMKSDKETGEICKQILKDVKQTTKKKNPEGLTNSSVQPIPVVATPEGLTNFPGVATPESSG